MDQTDHSPPWLRELYERLRSEGFLIPGIAPAVDTRGFNKLVEWIELGYAAEMDYFADRLDAYRRPSGVMPGAKSILVLAYPYSATVNESLPDRHGRIARYAWSGVDYHDTIHKKLKGIRRWLDGLDSSIAIRGCVDTAPLLEREFAQLAGLGWRGKNTLLLNKGLGSYFFLATLMFDVELPYDVPHESAHCGTCTSCLDECPTDAFVKPGVMDASRCISYLTIEHRGTIPRDMRTQIGDWVFGCDVCQEVCPWNRRRATTEKSDLQDSPMRSVDLCELLRMDEDEFRDRYRKSPLWRTRLRGMKRNAAIVLANRKEAGALEVIREVAKDEDDPVVLDAYHWAVEQLEIH